MRANKYVVNPSIFVKAAAAQIVKAMIENSILYIL